MQRLRAELAARDATLPTLYKQYVDLRPPDGARFLAFGVDPAFGHCVDGLIRIDLETLKPAKRAPPRRVRAGTRPHIRPA